MSKRRGILSDEERFKICIAAGRRLPNIASEGKTIRLLSFSDKLEPLLDAAVDFGSVLSLGEKNKEKSDHFNYWNRFLCF